MTKEEEAEYIKKQEEYGAKVRAKREAGGYAKPTTNAKSSGDFSWEKYKSPTPAPTATPTYNDPLKRDLSYAERLRKGFAGASR